MSSVITNIFSLMSTALSIITANPLLTVLIGMMVAALVIGLVLSIFRRKKGRR